jgi:hypothetical protein
MALYINIYFKLLLDTGGEGGIRTPVGGFSPQNGLANRRIQPLCHLSGDFVFSLTQFVEFARYFRGSIQRGMRL